LSLSAVSPAHPSLRVGLFFQPHSSRHLATRRGFDEARVGLRPNWAHRSLAVPVEAVKNEDSNHPMNHQSQSSLAEPTMIPNIQPPHAATPATTDTKGIAPRGK
jgi:hypothetical protein